MKIKKVLVLNTSMILLLLAACNVLNPTPVPTQVPPTPTILPTTGIQYHFVTSKLMLPTTQTQTQAFALNVDGDSQQHADNMFGTLLTLLTSAAPSLELQKTVDQAINSGQLVSLYVVMADDPMNDPSVSWSTAEGQKTQSAPLFDGSDKFEIDTSAPLNSPIVGSLANGHFTGGPGTARVQMLLMGQLIKLDLIGIRIEADLNATGCVNGKLGGGVTVDQFRGTLLPTVADGINQIAKVDKDVANTLLQLFDSDHSGAITAQELESNPLLMIAISPDLDLLDTTGNFNPGQDGVKDSYSVGLGFTCVPATFTTPDN